MAAITLSGLLHCGFLDMDKDMLVCTKHGVFQYNTCITSVYDLYDYLIQACFISLYMYLNIVCLLYNST